jgi:four helix bundle protein
MRDYRRLAVWEKSHKLTLDIYAATGSFPREEVYGLTTQLRRAASSVPTNIAEGCGRSGDAELRRFLFIAMGSANEMEYQLFLAKDLGYLSQMNYQPMIEKLDEVKRMLSGLINRIQSSDQDS